jgi:hypothetical protein
MLALPAGRIARARSSMYTTDCSRFDEGEMPNENGGTIVSTLLRSTQNFLRIQ